MEMAGDSKLFFFTPIKSCILLGGFLYFCDGSKKQ